MSWVQKLDRQSGTRYRANWRDPSGKIHSKVSRRKQDAKAHGLEMEAWRSTGVYLDPRLGRCSSGTSTNA